VVHFAYPIDLDEEGGMLGVRARFARAAPVAGCHAAVIRSYSAPERLGLSGLAATAAAFGYPRIGGRTGLRLPCPLRALTGVPCPVCGMTTAATRLAAGDLGAALAANPFVLVLAGLTAFMTALIAARSLGVMPPPAAWTTGRQRTARRVVGGIFAASWAFQLHRLEWI
jgi:hypothetical protein